MLDSGAEGPRFKSQPGRCRATVLGKLFAPIVPLPHRLLCYYRANNIVYLASVSVPGQTSETYAGTLYTSAVRDEIRRPKNPLS